MSRNITLAISDPIFEKMKQFTEVKWSEVARNAIEQRIEMLETLDKIASKSKLTEKDAEEIAKKVKQGIARRHKQTS